MRKYQLSDVIPAVLRSKTITAGIRKAGCPYKTGMTIVLMACLMTPAFAQTPAENGQPIEITATKSVEWQRGKNQYVARENVVVTQGNMTLLSDLLTADYRDGESSSMEIWQITAEGSVQIKDDKNTAYGDHGVYDVTNGVAVLTGQNLKLVSPDQTVTARDRMEYYSNERKAKAIGNAKVVRTKDTLTANVITAYFKEDGAPSNTQTPDNALGGGSLDRLEADGNVVIVTPTETLRGSKAVYRADSNTAEITGNVRIEQGENIMEGSRAEVDLNTNISKMFASNTENGRVRGIFFPGSKDNKPVAPSPAPAAPAPQTPVPPAETPSPQQPHVSQGTNTSGANTPPAAKVSPRLEY